MKIREDKIIKKGIKTTFKKTKKLILVSRALFLGLILFARQINYHYLYVIEPFLLENNLLSEDKTTLARQLVNKGYLVVMIISYIPNIFNSLKYENEEEKAKSFLSTFHTVLTPIKKDKKDRVIYKAEKIREDKLEHKAFLALLNEFSKIRKERILTKTSFNQKEFKGYIKALVKSNPTLIKYCELNNLDSMDIYYKWIEKLGRFIL